MALYIEEGPNLPEHVKLERSSSGRSVWLDWPREMLSLTGVIEAMHRPYLDIAVAAGWIVVREEEPPAPEVHVVGEPLEGVADMTDAELGAEVRRRLDAFAGVREEEPTPPTPDVGWIGTHVEHADGPRVAGLVGRDEFAYEHEGDIYIGSISEWTWEPPPEEEPVDDFYVTNEDVRRGREAAAAAMAVGVPEPDPQPIAWAVLNADAGTATGPLVVGTFGTEDLAQDYRGGTSTVHAVMPAGWKPREENDA